MASSSIPFKIDIDSVLLRLPKLPWNRTGDLSLPSSPTPYLIGVGALAIPTVYYFYKQLDPFTRSLITGQNLDLAQWKDEKYAKGRIHRAISISGPTVYLLGEHAGRWLLVQEKNNLLSGGEGRAPFVKRLLGGSLIDQDGAEHTRTRRHLAPAFKLEILRSYLPRMLTLIDSDFNFWVAKSAEHGSIDLQQEIKQLTLRIAFNLLIGADISVDDKEIGGRLIERYQNIFRGFLPWPLGEWNGRAKSDEAKKNVLEDVAVIIRKRMVDLENGKEPAEMDPLWLLIKQAHHENGDKLTVEELAHHALLLVIAGHETTAATVTSFIVTLLENPSIQTRIRAEQDVLYASRGRVHPTNEDLKHMPYLDAVFREVERMYPPAMQVQRRAKRDLVYTPVDSKRPVTIRKGELIMWDVGATNRDPLTYTNPDTFIPDRWLSPSTSSITDEDKDNATDLGAQKTSNFKLATFGAGHRVCLGMQFARMEMLVMGSLLVRDYEWVSIEEGKKFVRRVKPPQGWDGGVKVRWTRRA
ncbi:hypothetical protein HDV00_005616 [Rhizophlyctis rosea]|nr:hypothetical protein HDV00_005616 [Rhizophlyctis rosea]